MGLTFSLTSFACVGPFVGPLLASSVQAQRAQPVVGMAAFATGLASPFFFLALFPSYLKKLPKSGGWMAAREGGDGFRAARVMLKYLSNIDQVLQTNLLTRERFLAAWVVLFALPGLYLLGLLRLEGIEAEDQLGVGRLLTGAAVPDLRRQPAAGNVRRSAGRAGCLSFPCRQPADISGRDRRRREPPAG